MNLAVCCVNVMITTEMSSLRVSRDATKNAIITHGMLLNQSLRLLLFSQLAWSCTDKEVMFNVATYCTG